jgi:hypothetical protein
MAYIKIDDKAIVAVSDIMRAYPYVSFPNTEWTDEVLQPFGYAVLHRPNTHPFPSENEILVDGEPYEEGGKWYLPYIVRPLTPEEIEIRLNNWRESAYCTPFQGRVALANAGLLEQIESIINVPETNQEVKIAWEYAIEWRRMSPMILSMSTALGLTDEQVDELFRSAQEVSA